MKTIMYRVILFSAVGLMLVACVSIPKKKITIEELAGTTWVNEEYPPSSMIVRKVITSDGMIKFYSSVTPTDPSWTGKFTITESWYDKKGDLWFKYSLYFLEDGSMFYELSRISKSGTVWESCGRGSGYPAELNPMEGEYQIHYRQ